MSESRNPDELSIAELEQLLYRKKRARRQERLRRLKAEGRVVEIAGLPPPNPQPPPLIRPDISAAGAMQQYVVDEPYGPDEDAVHRPGRFRVRWRWLFDKGLLLLEVATVVSLLLIIISFLDTRRELNQELAGIQGADNSAQTVVEATAAPVIDVVVLPSGHKPPVEGRPPEPGEAGYIPEHLLPLINSYVPPPIPTPSPEQARRIQIPAINIDKPIVQGDDWEQLKKGVGQHIGSGLPGETGNLVLSAHNDIYGEIFRHLDKLSPGDEIIISTERQSYTYVVREIEVVEPTAVEVMAATDFATTTLISCYPYLVNNKRIVVFADLASDLSG